MDKILQQIMGLLQELDNADLDQFDIDTDSTTDVRNIRSASQSPSKRRGDNRRKSSRHDKSGKDKFESRRKVKKLNRLLKKAERNGIDLTDGIQHDDHSVQWRDTDAGWRVTVDRSDALFDYTENDDGTITVTVRFKRIDDEHTTQLPIADPCVTRTVNNGITVFTLTPAASDGDSDSDTDTDK
jgi:hypothetical protein